MRTTLRTYPVYRGVREPHSPAFRGLGSALLPLVKGGSGKALVDHGGTNLMECLPRGTVIYIYLSAIRPLLLSCLFPVSDRPYIFDKLNRAQLMKY